MTPLLVYNNDKKKIYKREFDHEPCAKWLVDRSITRLIQRIGDDIQREKKKKEPFSNPSPAALLDLFPSEKKPYPYVFLISPSSLPLSPISPQWMENTLPTSILISIADPVTVNGVHRLLLQGCMFLCPLFSPEALFEFYFSFLLFLI